MNVRLIKNYLVLLDINSYEELKKLGIDGFWQIKFKKIQSDKFIGQEQKEILLIEINNARDELNDIDYEDLKRIINNSNRKKASNNKAANKRTASNNNEANKTKTSKSYTNASSKKTYQRTEKSPMGIKHPQALIGFLVLIFAGLISIPFIQEQNPYKTANRNQIYDKNNSDLNKKVFKKINYSNGDRYEGEFLNGKKNGYGIFFNNNGDRYEGNWSNGWINGYGTYYFRDGNIYQGYFLKAIKTGKGKFYWSDGNRYDGDWLNDERTGKGKFYWSDGNRYEGEFLNGKKNGYGIYYWSNGDRYDGYWLNGKRTGKG